VVALLAATSDIGVARIVAGIVAINRLVRESMGWDGPLFQWSWMGRTIGTVGAILLGGDWYRRLSDAW
jgi:hypothetical protein